MTTKPLRFPTSGFKANELYEPGFLWYEGKPVAFVSDHFAVQLLLPAELLERHPYYSASFNGFIEISSSIVWMAPVFVMNLIRAWTKRYFGANFKEDFHTVKNAVKNLFGFHTGYPDLVRRIKYPAPDDSLLYPAALPIEKTFKETVREAQAADFHYLYEVTPLWSNHVRKSTCTDRMRCGRMKVKLNSLVDIQTSRNLVLEGLSDLHYEYDGLLGICIRKLDCNGKLIDYWFIPSQMIKHDMFTSQYRHYIVDYELANRLSVADAPKTKAREVDQRLDAVAWSKDQTLDAYGLEEIALVMISLEEPKHAITRYRHILSELFVNETALGEVIEKIEASSEGRHTKGAVKAEKLRQACLERAIEFTGAKPGHPLQKFYPKGASPYSLDAS